MAAGNVKIKKNRDPSSAALFFKLLLPRAFLIVGFAANPACTVLASAHNPARRAPEIYW